MNLEEQYKIIELRNKWRLSKIHLNFGLPFHEHITVIEGEYWWKLDPIGEL